MDKHHYPPLLSYLEALPSLCNFDQEDVHKHLHADGSLFQSPSATARAFMATGNKDCLNYLRALAQRSTNGGYKYSSEVYLKSIILFIITCSYSLVFLYIFFLSESKYLRGSSTNLSYG